KDTLASSISVPPPQSQIVNIQSSIVNPPPSPTAKPTESNAPASLPQLQIVNNQSSIPTSPSPNTDPTPTPPQPTHHSLPPVHLPPSSPPPNSVLSPHHSALSPSPLEQTLELLVQAQATRVASSPGMRDSTLHHFLRHITRQREHQLRQRALDLRQKSLAFKM